MVGYDSLPSEQQPWWVSAGRRDRGQHDGPPAHAGHRSGALHVDAAVRARAWSDGAQGAVRADHEIAYLGAAAVAGGIARQRP